MRRWMLAGALCLLPGVAVAQSMGPELDGLVRAYVTCSLKAARNLAAERDDPLRLAIIAEWACGKERDNLAAGLYRNNPEADLRGTMDGLRKIIASEDAAAIEDWRKDHTRY